MSLVRIHRYRNKEELAYGAAHRLVSEIVAIQRSQDAVNLCLSHGSTADSVYEALANLPTISQVDPCTIAFWWNSENFVSTTDPARNATKTLATLGGGLQLVPAQTHPMPSKSGNADPDDAAFAYAADLDDTIFDICMLGLGSDGHVAAIYPEHQSFKAQAGTSLQVIGVTNAPEAPHERISLTFKAINRSRQVWFFVSGEHKAKTVTAVLNGDTSLPASHVHGVERTVWFVDEAAASLLPTYHCSL